MMCPTKPRAVAACLAAIACLLASPSLAQVSTGRIDITIEDSSGGRIPGVTVQVSGPDEQTQIADAEGQAHFLNMPVGVYTVKLTLVGFAPYTSRNVEVTSNASTALDVKMAVASANETVNVVAVTPAVDVRRDTTTVNISITDLQELPTSGDPWSLLQTVPS